MVDGAEAVLEGQDLTLQDLATSALRQGFTVVAISRSDGANAVLKSLGNACATAGLGVPMTFPPQPLRGCQVSCFLTPGPESNFTYPAELKAELAAASNALVPQNAPGDPEAAQAELAARAGLKLPTYVLFERTGRIALIRLLKVLDVLGLLDDFDQLGRKEDLAALTLDDITRPERKHGRQKL